MTNDIEKLIRNVNRIKDDIYDLNYTIAEKMLNLNEEHLHAKQELDAELARLAAENLKSKEYGCGTANLDTDNFKVKVVIGKKVKWNEDILEDIEKVIEGSGGDPANFIKYKRSVSEAAYKGFSPDIREVFSPAREVVPALPKITIEGKI